MVGGRWLASALVWHEGPNLVSVAHVGAAEVDLVEVAETLTLLDERGWSELMAAAPAPRGILGVWLEDVPEGGAVITEVLAGSGAAHAGLLAGDVIVRVDGEPIETAAQLKDRLEGLRVGNLVRLTVVSDSAESTVDATIGERP